MNKLNNKTALITGCNRGIGRAIMELFMQEGANIVACTRSMTDELKDYYKKSESQYSIHVYALSFDLSDEDSVKNALKELYSLKINVDILINNAGVAAGGFLLFSSSKKLKEVFQVNYFSQVLITQYVSKLMMKQKTGNIVFMSSVMGMDAAPGGTMYGASKAAIALLAKSLSKELGAYNIRVNAVAPNLIETEMAHEMEQKSFDNMVQQSTLKRLGTPEEIAKTVLFLVSDDSSYITGQIIRVDGGM